MWLVCDNSIGQFVVMVAATPAIRVGALALALAASPYLVSEELVVEGPKVDDGTSITSIFFVGFLMALLVEDFAP